MTNVVIQTNFEIMEISEEEKALILKARAEHVREEEIKNTAKEIKNLLNKIHELGGTVSVYGPSGKYVPYGDSRIDLRIAEFSIRY